MRGALGRPAVQRSARRALLLAHRSRAAVRRQWLLPSGAPGRPSSDLASLRRARRLPIALARQIRRAERWPLQADDAWRAWLQATADHHLAQRAQLDGGRPNAGNDPVTVICATERPGQLEHVLATCARQDQPLRLILVTNSSGFDRPMVEARLADVPGATVIHVDEDESLGTCLNAALERVTTRFAAKIDDDDWYGRRYLSDLLRAQHASGAAVTGKHTHCAHLVDRDEVVVRFPGREMAFTSFVAGGTLLLDLEQLDGIRFPDQTLGEDKGLLERCLERRRSVFSADRFGYLQHRGAANTWDPGAAYLQRTVSVDPSTPWGRYDL